MLSNDCQCGNLGLHKPVTVWLAINDDKMNFQQFQILGEEIHAKFKSRNCDEQMLPGLAAEALARVNLDADFRLDQLADFLIATKIEQQPSLHFSNLPPVVYRCEDFYIELLVWTEATTTIHQHGFSGAFRVLVGSSFHSAYEFTEHERISSRLLLGDTRLKSVEILRTGDVRQIRSGRNGLVHALFHLDRPSVTVVVRNGSEPWSHPQYTLEPPHLAYAQDELKRDSKVRLLSRLLAVASVLDREEAVELLVSKGTSMDFPRLLMVLMENYERLNKEADWLRFMNAARNVHGHLAEHLVQIVKSAKRTASLVAARNSVKDPELRFFLALLLNLPSRAWMYRLIKESFPRELPEILCRRWLQRLRDEESLSNAFFELAKKVNLGADAFGARLKAAVPFEREDPRTEAILCAALTGVSPEAVSAHLQEILGDKMASPEALDAYGRLRQLTELEPLFAD
jgi:hypothetical protein